MTASPTTFIVVRHGETVWNAQQRFQGHGDSPLTDLGRSEVQALGRRLGRMAFDRLICSDLGRALETAEIIARHTGHDVEKDRRLRERHYGMLEGLTIPEIKSGHPVAFERLLTGDPDYVVPQGESHRQQYLRNINFFEAWVSQNSGSTVLLVAHGGLLDSLFRFVTQMPLNQPRCFFTANASLSIIAHGPFPYSAPWIIQSWNDRAHLERAARNP